MTRDILGPGTAVGPFVVEGLIGRGGMGDVYRALQPSLDRRVALKLLAGTLAGQESFAARFLREARTMRSLEHPGVVTIYDAGEADGQLYLAMRLVTGSNLKQLMSEHPLSTEQALALLRPLAEVIDYAHGRGIIHRDIKPANILIDEDGHPVLADFGLAKALDDTSMTLSSDFLGTPLYLAPEQASAGMPVGPPADIYSFGCVAFELLTGTAPYTEQDSLGLLLAHGSKPVPHATERNASLPRAIDDVLARALAKAPTDRYPSARMFVAYLDAAATGRIRSAGRGRRASRLRGLARRRRTVIIAVGIIVSLLGGLVAGRMWFWPGPEAPRGGADQGIPITHALTSATVPRGNLIYSAQMNGTSNSFTDLIGRGPNTSARQVVMKPGELELAALGPRVDAGTDLNISPVMNYVADMTISIKPGSDVQLNWGLRWAIQGKLAYALCVFTAAESAQLMVYDGKVTYQPITERVALPGLQTGRTISLTVVVRDTHLTLLVDGTVRADVEDHQVPPEPTYPNIDVLSNTHTGAVDIHSVNLYSLATN